MHEGRHNEVRVKRTSGGIDKRFNADIERNKSKTVAAALRRAGVDMTLLMLRNATTLAFDDLTQQLDDLTRAGHVIAVTRDHAPAYRLINQGTTL